MRGRLRRDAEDVPAVDRLPYYMVFESGVFGAATESTWTLVRDRIGSALPSLRLVRLTGGADDPEDNEWRLVYALRDLLRRDP